MEEEDLYKVLGVGRDATQEEIEKAYREKAMTAHPDKGGSTEEMAKLAFAKEVLSDPERRANYDRTGGTDGRRREVDQAVRDLVGTVMASDHPPREPVKFMCEQVDRTRSQCRAQMQLDQRKLKKLVSRKNKFIKQNAQTENPESRDVIVGLMESAIEGLRSSIANQERNIETANEVLTFFNGLKAEDLDQEADRPGDSVMVFSGRKPRS